MITNRKLLLMLLFFISCSLHAMAQDYFYYYKGTKIPLTLNENKVVVSISKEFAETSQRIRANVELLSTIGDEIYNIFVITRSDYEKLTTMDTWEEDSKSVVLTLCYYTENGQEVYASPYMNVRLKKEEDMDLLTSCAETYKLMITWHSPNMPLWYVLALTPESGKNSVECANELYETGFFSESTADFVDSGNWYDGATPVRSIATTEESSSIFDLQGQRLSKMQKGINILRGRKILVK